MTRQKKMILEIIESSHDHLTAEEIYLKAKVGCPSIAVGTVYRNLGILCKEGRIQKISIPDQPDCYDRKTNEHAHYVCSRCGRVEDASIAGLREFLQEQANHEIEGFSLTLKYVCDDCRNQQDDEAV